MLLDPLEEQLDLPAQTRSVFPFSARWRSGEPLELVARETNVSIARLSGWRERALAGAATALNERERDDRDDEITRLKSKVGEITMDNELLYAKIAAMEGKRPLAPRRSRR
jgi:transposase